MAQINAFRGIRYNLGRVGALSDVVAPPYDVIDPLLQERLYSQHPYNVIRLILNRRQPDDSSEGPYQRAAADFRLWQRDGVLMSEGEPALYVYDQEFTWDGVTHTRRAFICRVRLERFGEGSIYPHEQTHPKAKADRLMLMKACKANLSPVFGLYADTNNEVLRTLNEATAGVAGLEATDHLGVRHTMWPVKDVRTIGKVVAALGGQALYVADGHHRYETACDYRDYLEQTQGPLPPDHPAHYAMMACVSLNDPGLLVLPTHRLLRGVPQLTFDELQSRLGDCFICEPGPEGPAGAEAAWEAMQFDDDQEMLALYVEPQKNWVFCQATPAAMSRLQHLEPDHSDEWRGLGVSLLHRLVLEDLLGAAGHPKPTYVHSIQEVIDGLEGRGQRSEEEAGGAYSMAALVQPATLDHVQAISLNNERMPAKSTYFYPKLLSGLVFNPLA